LLIVAEDRRPVGGRDYPRTYQEFRSWFPDELASGWTALAARILLSKLRQRWQLADGHRAADVHRL